MATYWLTRIVLLRFLGFIYLVAFLISFNQNKGLIGENGLLPAQSFVSNILPPEERHMLVEKFLSQPTLFLIVEPNDLNLERFSLLGALLAIFVMITGSANMLIMFSLWVIYMSIVNIGQTWYSFGWESQLLETGFLAIFAVPLFSLNTFSSTVTPQVVVWGYRWLLFRIMLGAGLIKVF